MNHLIQRKYIITILLIYMILVVTIFWIGGFPYLTGDFIAFGQLVLELLLLPTVIIGFLIAVEEFRKSQTTPDLDLLWETQPKLPGQPQRLEKELHLTIPATGTTRPAARPLIVNNGNAVAIWYVFHLDFPLEELFPEELKLHRENRLANPVEIYISNYWTILTGSANNRRFDFLGSEIMRITFMSNGQVAAYPKVPESTGLLTIPLHAKHNYPEKCQIEYAIATDTSQVKQGILTIRFRQET